MVDRNEVHVHIPSVFRGVIHLHVGSDAEGATLPVDGDDAVTTSEVEMMLKRFETFDPTTAARKVYETLEADGWETFVPTSRDGSESKNSYLRFVYKGTRRRVVLYANTVALISGGARERDVVKTFTGAEVKPREIYIYFSEGRLRQALDAAERLRRWADGES